MGGANVPTCTAAIKTATHGSFLAGLLTVLTASHGGAEDGGIFFVVECVAVSVHWMVEKREVPMEEGKG